MTAPRLCSFCHKRPGRFAQFPFCVARACDACTRAHGGWREEDEDESHPLAFTFPRERTDDLI